MSHFCPVLSRQPACLLPPLLPRGLRIVSTSSSLHRARAARSHLGSSRHTTSVPIRTMQTLTVIIGVPCSCYFLSVRKPFDPPHACRPVAFSPSPSAISFPRPFAHSLARQNAQRAALPATKAGRRTVVCASVPVYGDHISQSHGPRSDNTGETRATPTL